MAPHRTSSGSMVGYHFPAVSSSCGAAPSRCIGPPGFQMGRSFRRADQTVRSVGAAVASTVGGGCCSTWKQHLRARTHVSSSEADKLSGAFPGFASSPRCISRAHAHTDQLFCLSGYVVCSRGAKAGNQRQKLPLSPRPGSLVWPCGETARLARADRQLSKFRVCVSILGGAVAWFVEVILFRIHRHAFFPDLRVALPPRRARQDFLGREMASTYRGGRDRSN